MYYHLRTQRSTAKGKKQNIVLSSMVILSVLFFGICSWSFYVEDQQILERCLQRESSNYCYKTIYG